MAISIKTQRGWYSAAAPTQYDREKRVEKKFIPKYAYIKIENTSPAAKYTKTKIYKQRIKDEIKIYLCQETHQNPQFYKLRLMLAAYWGKQWTLMEQSVNEKSESELIKCHICQASAFESHPHSF